MFQELIIEVWWIWFAKTSFSFPGNNFPSSISTEGLNDVILYHQPDDKKKNRGFCFLEYEDHKTAAQARRRLMSGKVKVWGNVVTVEWADPIEDPDPEVMAKVRCFPLAQCKNSILCLIWLKSYITISNFISWLPYTSQYSCFCWKYAYDTKNNHVIMSVFTLQLSSLRGTLSCTF